MRNRVVGTRLSFNCQSKISTTYIKLCEKMNFRERLLTQILWNLVQFLLGAMGQLEPEDLNLPKGTRAAFLNPIIKFEPFESLSKNLHRSNKYVREADFNHGRIRKNVTEIRTQTDRRKSENMKSSKGRKTNEDGRRLKIKPRNKAQVGGNQGRRVRKTRAYNYSREEIVAIKKQVKDLKKLFDLLGNMKEELEEFDGAFSADSLEKLLRGLERSHSSGKEEEDGVKNRNKGLKERKDETGLKEINNISYNNQYQIDGIFIINRLSEEREGFGSKFNEYKGTDAEIIKELTGSQTKEVFEKKLNNLNVDSVSKATEGDFLKVTQPSLLPGNEMDSAEQLLRNFAKFFPRQNVTLEHIEKMSKIIDFVERYHGVVSDLDTLVESVIPYHAKEESGKKRKVSGPAESRRSRTDRKVLCCDGGLEFFGGFDTNQRSSVRKKGKVTSNFEFKTSDRFFDQL